MINFKLKPIEIIQPWGQKPEQYLSWYGLTEGDLWLTFGNETIYEYTKEAISHFGNKLSPYSDYYLIQFIQDFTEIFDKIPENIPQNFYDLTKNFDKFLCNAQKWLDIYETNEDEYSDFYFEEYDKLISWINQRTFGSMHLIGGPHLSFFRRNDKIRIIWDTEHLLENGISLWTAKNGAFEMNYTDFVDRIKTFGQSFFDQMDAQVELALAKEWGNIKIDKQKLVVEQRERKSDFFSSFLLLEREPTHRTNWTEIDELFKRMTKEIK